MFNALTLITVTIFIPTRYRSITGAMLDSINTCTAVAIAPDRLLTAAHCLEGQTEPVIIKHHVRVKVVILKKDVERDLALLQVKGLKLKYASFGKEPGISDKVYTVNSGEGHENTYNEGVIQNICKDSPEDKQVHIKSSVMIAQGASGSGLFDVHGQLVGINVIKEETGSLAVDLETIKHFLK